MPNVVAFTQRFSCSASLFLDNLMVFSWKPEGIMAYPAENAFHRIPQWWNMENLLVNVSWFDAACTGDIDFVEAIENVNDLVVELPVDGPNLVNNLGSPLFQYSYSDSDSDSDHKLQTQMGQKKRKLWQIDLVVIVLQFLDIQPDLLKRYDMKPSTNTPQNISKLPKHTPNISECISNVAVYWF